MFFENSGTLISNKVGKRGIGVFLLVAGLALLVSCKGGNASVSKGGGKAGLAASATTLSPVSDSDAPKVEAALTIPAIEKGSEGLLIVYRETRFGYVESYGADTFIYRFTFLPGGWIDGVTLNERRVDGETSVARYSFSYAGNEIQIFESAGKESTELSTVVLSPDRMELKGRGEGTVSLQSDGRLIFASSSGNHKEEYRLTGKKEDMKCIVSQGDFVEAEGLYAVPKKGRIVYTERETQDTTGAEATTIELWVDGKNDYRFRTDGIVPINEVYISGLKDTLASDKGLQNLVLIGLVLGESRNIKPVLAYALSESKDFSR